MKRTIAATAAVLALSSLTACGGGDDDKQDQAAANPGATAPAPAAASDDREAKLLVATQGYVNALLAGKLAGVVGYLDPQVCDDEDRGSYALTIGEIKEVAEGATMKILSVKLYEGGARGGADKYELSKNAPDGLRRLIKASFAEATAGSWTYRDGEWYLTGPCEDDESASPSPTT